jgi:hypothetical protein
MMIGYAKSATFFQMQHCYLFYSLYNLLSKTPIYLFRQTLYYVVSGNDMVKTAFVFT